MSDGWSRFKLGDMLEITSSKRIFRSDYVKNGVPFYRSKEVIERAAGLNVSTELFIREEKFNELAENFGVPSQGDILLTSVGTLGVSYQVQKGDKFYFKDGNLTWFRNLSGRVDGNYLLCWLRSSLARIAFDQITIGSTQKALTIVGLKSIELSIPEITLQRSIAEILSSLDEKIALNREQNRTLEAIAQALFKRWFVEFEFPDENGRPYKSSGGTMQPSELGEIPVGWEIGALGDVVEQRTERVAPSQRSRDIPYVPIDCISPASLFLQGSKDGEEAQSSLIRFYEGDILFGAMRPYFHKVCIAPFAGTTRTTCFVLKPRSADDFAYATLSLHDAGTIDFATKQSTGSTIPYAKWESSLDTMEIVLPPPEVRKDFNALVYPLLSRIPPRYFENQSLAQIRDTLLPKLMSGALRVA